MSWIDFLLGFACGGFVVSFACFVALEARETRALLSGGPDGKAEGENT